MIQIKRILGGYLFRPRVIHRLPGRIRVSVPIIRQIPERFNGVANQLMDKIKLKDGIKTVDLNFISGNVLIYFRSDVIDEDHVMKWMYSLYDLIWEIEERISKLPESERNKAAIQIAKYLKNVDTNGIDLERKEAIFASIGQ